MRPHVLSAFVLWVAGACTLAGAGEQPDIVKLSGLPASQPGVGLVLGGDAKLAADIAAATKLRIFLLARDEAACTADRRWLDQAGLYGTRVTAMAGAYKPLPFPNGFANLIVTGEPLDQLDLKEIARVLNPNGAAVIGAPGADAAKLQAALEQAGIKDARPAGGYAVVRGKPPAGDDWTHYRRGPDNNSVSTDPAIRPPFLTQWISGPGRTDWGGAYVANGRYVLKSSGELFVKDAFNGIDLWSRKLTLTAQDAAVLMGDRLYLLEKDELLVLDAATGATLKTFRPLGAGPTTTAPAGKLVRLTVIDDTAYVLAARQGDGRNPNLGDTFLAVGLADGKVAWTYPVPKPVQEGSVACGSGALYCYVPGLGAIALDLKTGQERWLNTTDASGVLKAGRIGAYVGVGLSWAVYHDGAVYFAGDQGQLVALDAGTGKLLWSELARRPLFVGDKLYAYPRGGEFIAALDPHTGKRQATTRPAGGMSGCGTGTAAAECIFSAGQGFTAYDLPTGKNYSYHVFRSGCATGVASAEGMIFTAPPTCGCNYSITGAVAMAPAGENWRPAEAGKDWDARLVKGPAYAPKPAVAQADWPCFRHDSGHTGVTPATADWPAQIKWQQQLAGKLTPPAAAEGLVFVGADTGAVYAISQTDGKVAWKFLCGAGVPITPTWAAGRLYFGSMDGWAYCVQALTGTLCWKVRAAPADRYIGVLGQTISTWPVLTGVAVEGGAAYFAAGLSSCDGAYLYAVAAETGKLLWARQIGWMDDRGRGMNPQGPLALTKDLVLVPAGGDHPAAFARKDGALAWSHAGREPAKEFKVSYAKFNYSGGTELVAEGDAFFVGGPRLVGDKSAAFILCDVTYGLPYGTVDAARAGTVPLRSGLLWEHYLESPMPILTADTVFVTGLRTVAAYDRAKLAAVQVAGYEGRTQAAKDAALWSVDVHLQPQAFALAGTRILVANREALVAIDPAEKKVLGQAKLPGKVIPHGLAIAGGQTIIVTQEGAVVGLGK